MQDCFYPFTEMANALRQGACFYPSCSLRAFFFFFNPRLCESSFTDAVFVYRLQFDPEGFGEIPLEDFVAALRSPEWRAEIPANKRDILLTRVKESRVQAVTFQDFVNVVSLLMHAM